jgi:GntR family transcriptional regulator/MocR family aminotransferase
MLRDWTTSGVDLFLNTGAETGRRVGVEAALREAVQSGRLAAGTRIPATRTLAQQLGLSRGTVVAAFDQLTAEGYLTATPGVGTVVSTLPPSAAAPAPSPPPAPARLDLNPGNPDIDRFPAAAWLRSSRRVLSSPAQVLRYGDPRGSIALREALAAYLGRTRGVRCTPENVVITSGSVQALALLGRTLARSSPAEATAAVEDPSWSFQREVLRHSGLRLVPLPVDGQGARLDELAGDDAAPAAVFVTPSHQYPCGVTLAPARRIRLTQWAQATGGLVVEDDYDGEFRYDRTPVGSLQGTAPDQVAYVGSASKSLAPGLRIGWMVLPQRLIEPVIDERLHSDVHNDALTQATLADLITSHEYDRHIRASRHRYRHRRDHLLAALQRSGLTDAGIRPRGIAAGLHLLLPLPSSLDEKDVVDLAASEDLALLGLSESWQSATARPALAPGLVIGYGTPSEGAYPAAVTVLIRVLRRSLAADPP